MRAPESYRPGRIQNHYSLFLPGEEEALRSLPAVKDLTKGALTAQLSARSVLMRPGDQLEGWRLVGIFVIEEVSTSASRNM